jgi:lipopolysaccharide biosynthesis protein
MSDHSYRASLSFLHGEINQSVPEQVCLYTHFDYEDVVDPYVFNVLKVLQECGFSIVFISTCNRLIEQDIERLSNYCSAVVLRENKGLDFGGWAQILMTYPQLLEAEQLLLTNDSVYVVCADLKLYFDKIKADQADFWGMTESFQTTPHLQSYFLLFEKKVIQSDVFKQFWEKYEHIDDKQRLIAAYELRLTKLLTSAGFSYASLLDQKVNCAELEDFWQINPAHHLWKALVVHCDAPFVKVELFRNNPFNADISGLDEICFERGGSYTAISQHLARVSPYYKIDKNEDAINFKLNNIAALISTQFLDQKAISLHRKIILKHAVKRVVLNPLSIFKVIVNFIRSTSSFIRKELIRSFEDEHQRHVAAGVGRLTNGGLGLSEYRALMGEERDTEVSEADIFSIKQHAVLNQTAVVCHIFYSDLYGEISTVLRRIPDADIYISLVEGHSDDLRAQILEDFPNSFVQVFKNHGRDIYPFYKFVESGKLFEYEAVLKLHGKASKNSAEEYAFDGEAWRREIFNELAPKKDIEGLIAAFIGSKNDGMLSANDYIFGEEHLGANEESLEMLCGILGMKFDREKLIFAGGSMFWVKPWLLRHVSALGLSANDFPVEPLPVDGSLAHALERFLGVLVDKAGCRVSSPKQLLEQKAATDVTGKVDVIAFYLPQFHPIKENDIWWGKGFTEWRNVARAKPMFDMHRQPRIPEELGYYDLRMPDVQVKQASLAQDYGLSAFCFYHYWFSGEQLLTDPIDSFCENPDIDLKFLLCWANENWTRSWDGMNKDVLKEQLYEDGWGRDYARSILKYIGSDCYYRRNGLPVLLIYNVSAIPECKMAMQDIRSFLIEEGIGQIEIIAVWFYGVELDANLYGVDGFSEFSPHRLDFSGIDQNKVKQLNSEFKGNIYDYEAVAESKIRKIRAGENESLSLGVMCGWDNTARRMEKSDIFYGSSPAVFRHWLNESYNYSLSKSSESNTELIFINAWNEWAEGTYLEPDTVYGRAYLEAVKSVIK